MDLLERKPQLAALAQIHRGASAGRGCVVSVSGPVGTGKTAMVTAFAAGVPDRPPVRWGWCDDLVVQRPLAPFRDILPNRVDNPMFLDTLVDDLRDPGGATVVVIEDAQWADEATLEAIQFLGRRIERAPIMLIVTHRSDDVPDRHPLRITLGSLSAAGLRRIKVGPLSEHAVAELAGSVEEADRIYRLTAGNPFYVQQMLAAPDAWVPEGVQDAVAARLARLEAPARHTVDALAPVPGRAESWLVSACDAHSGLDAAVRSGFLVMDAGNVRFGHELTRRAVLGSMDTGTRRHYDAQILEALRAVELQRNIDPARLVHHAVAADDVTAIVHYAPLAADRAAAMHAHREAARHLQLALDHADEFAPGQLAELYDKYTDECELTNIGRASLGAATRAVELRESLGDVEALAASLFRLADLQWGLGNGHEARRCTQRAITLVENRPPSSAQLEVFGLRAKLAMVDYRFDEALTWGNRAIAVARTLGDDRGRAQATVTVGTVRSMRDADEGPLIDALALALSVHAVVAAARAYVNLTESYLLRMRDDLARAYGEDGVTYCRDHDLVTAADYIVALISQCDLQQGRWADADTAAHSVVSSPTDAQALLVATYTLAALAIRRAESTAADAVSRVLAVGEAADDAQSVIPAYLIRAEHGFLRGDLDDVAKVATTVFDLAVSTDRASWIGQAALWLHRVGRLEAVPGGAAEPYVLHIHGRVRDAAQRWEALGRPYEQADALVDSDDPEDIRRGLHILDRLGAVPRADQARARLVALGVASIPRGPRQSTRANPANLTERQLDVLELLADDLTYREIANRLHVSVKTVDHHVSAVRAKLDVATRQAAVEKARKLGILSDDRHDGA